MVEAGLQLSVGCMEFYLYRMFWETFLLVYFLEPTYSRHVCLISLFSAVALISPYWSVIFQVSVALLIIAPMYMLIFLTETVKLTPDVNQHLRWSSKAYQLVQDRYSSMRYALHVVTSRSYSCFIWVSSISYFRLFSGIGAWFKISFSFFIWRPWFRKISPRSYS